MIYFIEHDSQGNIVHACFDPAATIVPLINRVTFMTSDGTPNRDAAGNDLSSYGYPLVEPVGIDETTYLQILPAGIENFTFNPTTNTVSRKEHNDAQEAS